MAGNFDMVFSHVTEELLGGNRLRAVRAFGFLTKPSGVYLEFRLPLAAALAGEVAGVATVLADEVEVLMADHRVAGLVYIQDVDATGQLKDELEIVLQSDDGQATGTLLEPLSNISTANIGGAMQAVVDELNAIMAL